MFVFNILHPGIFEPKASDMSAVPADGVIARTDSDATIVADAPQTPKVKSEV